MMLGRLLALGTLDAGPVSPQISKHWPSLWAGQFNTAAPTITRSGNDHPHTSGVSFAGSSAMGAEGPLFCQGRWWSASSMRPRQHNISPPTWSCPVPATEQTCEIERMVVFCWRHYRPCGYALLCSCWLVSLLILSVGPSQLAVWWASLGGIHIAAVVMAHIVVAQ